jgi:putative restriction endonuclease
VQVGQLFVDRRELHEAGVHRPPQAGISGTAADGADSIVVSGGYADDEDYGDEILYTGHGGNVGGRQVRDQTIEAPGNAGLITSRTLGLPVRVIRGPDGTNPYAPIHGYRYAGLYQVDCWWLERGLHGYQIVRFRLLRIPEQDPYVVQTSPDQDPAFAETTVSRRVRDTVVSRELKRFYDYECQLCGNTILGLAGHRYAEGAHVRPLGRPHLGSDSKGNLLCLCPNHHTCLDLGGIFINDDMSVFESGGRAMIGELSFKKAHRLDVANVVYHRQMWRLTN